MAPLVAELEAPRPAHQSLPSNIIPLHDGFGYRGNGTFVPWKAKRVNGNKLLTKEQFSKHFRLRERDESTTWKVYVYDLQRRDSYKSLSARQWGECWESAEAVAKVKHLSLAQVYAARRHLQELGLEASRWAMRGGRQRFVRVVYGNLGSDYQHVIVPQKAIDALKAHRRGIASKPGNGGARPGAGRPRGNSKDPSREFKRPLKDLLLSEEARGSFASLGTQAHKEGAARPRPSSSLKSPPPPSRSSSASPSQKVPTMPLDLGLLSEQLSQSRPAPPSLSPEAMALVPAIPYDRLAGPTVPHPPDLPDDTDEDYDVLGRAYQQAVRYVSGKEVYPSRVKRNMKLGQLERTLGASAAALRAHRLPPILWAVWCVRSFHRNGIATPPMSWVWNAARIKKQHGWCRSELGSELGGRLFIPPSALEVQRRYRQMWADLARVPAGDAAHVRVVVDAWFPAGLLDRLTKKAVAEAVAKREALAKGIARGDWIWG